MDSQRLAEFFKWFVKFRNPKEILKDNASFLAFEIVLYFCFLLTLKHAVRHGCRNVCLIIGIVVYGFILEFLTYIIPDLECFWHAQSSIMLLGQRLPLHILCFYPVILYTAFIAASRMKLSIRSEVYAVGLAAVIMNFPVDILGVKLLWWTFHDTDPNIADRFYWVPWSSPLFFLAFSSGFALLLQLFRRLFFGKDNCQKCCIKELLSSVLTAMLAIPLGILKFVVIYHVPHDIYNVPTSVCVLAYFALLILITWTGDRSATAATSRQKSVYQKNDCELFGLVVVFFSFLIMTVLLVKPENIFSVGLHQTVGNCNATIPVQTPIGVVLSKKKYLCAVDYDEGYFDFHCAIQATQKWKNKKQYTICGTPFENRNEYIAVILSSALFGLCFYYQLLNNCKRRLLDKTQGKETKVKTT